MFSKASKTSGDGQTRNGQGKAVPSIISSDLTIIGNLVTEGDIQIDGTIEGDIKSHTVTVGEEAVVSGQIVADFVRVNGRVNGQITAREVALGKTAHVVGDVLHESLSINAGARLEGHYRRLDSAAKGETDRLNLVVGNSDKADDKNKKDGAGKAAPAKVANYV